MTPIRHNQSDGDGVLDAVRDCVLAVGVRRTTLTDVARRAGVSRMTLYRRWPDVRSLVGDLMTREWVGVATGAMPERRAGTDARTLLVDGLVAGVAAFRDHPLFRKIVDVDPDLLLRYVLDRRGASRGRRGCWDGRRCLRAWIRGGGWLRRSKRVGWSALSWRALSSG